MRILSAVTSSEIGFARRLFEQYANESKLDLCFQNFAEELQGLPGAYAPPDGRLLLAEHNKRIAGCVALRRFDASSCEMKRLYVQPEMRGQGIGRVLAEAVIVEARQIGYQRMLLDTLGRMPAAIALYESMGFQRVGPYRFNPEADAVFMELVLTT